MPTGKWSSGRFFLLSILRSSDLRSHLQSSREPFCHASKVQQYGYCACECLASLLPYSVGHDVIAQAQSGTGKTATFAIAILQKIDITKQNCQALVLAPTRELAQQVWT